MKTKHIIIYSVLLALLISVFAFCALNVDAAGETSGECGENLTWRYDSDTKTLYIEGYGEMGEYPRGAFPWSAFSEDVTDLVFPVGITVIADYAFEKMPIEKACIPDTVTHIGNYAFMSTALKSVTLNDGLKFIGSCAFLGIYIEELVIPDTVTNIGSMAFTSCELLNTVSIGRGITEIPNSCFSSCKRLNNVIIPDTVTVIGENSFACCDLLSEIDFGKNVRLIENYAFNKCGFTDLVLPDSLQEIGGAAFKECKYLTNVTLGKNVKRVYDFAFADCGNLVRVVLNDGLNLLISGAFRNCDKLETLTVPESVERFVYSKFGWTIGELYVNSADAIKEMHDKWDFSTLTELRLLYLATDKADGLSCLNTASSEANVFIKKDVSYYEYNMKNGKEKPFSHNLELFYDEYYHFTRCKACEYQSNGEIHRYEKDRIVKIPTFFSVGIKKESCQCGYSRPVEISAVKITDTWVIVAGTVCLALIITGAAISAVVIKKKKKNNKTSE